MKLHYYSLTESLINNFIVSSIEYRVSRSEYRVSCIEYILLFVDIPLDVVYQSQIKFELTSIEYHDIEYQLSSIEYSIVMFSVSVK